MSVERDTLFLVCSGNTCRSPMAAALLRSALAHEGGRLAALKVESRGLAAYQGDPASPHAVRALRPLQLSLAEHVSRPLTSDDVARALAIFVMGNGHLNALFAQFDDLPEAVELLRGRMPEGQDREIADPFGGNLATYEDCRDSMIEALPKVVAMLRERFV